MAAKLPLITTSVGAEGLGATHGENIIVQDDPISLAEATLEIIGSEAKAKQIADNARKLVEEKFSWYKMSEYLDRIYEDTAYARKKT
jgi:glycosyltransferase involved in cell wall biosynthesis